MRRLISSILVGVLAATCVGLGVWQLGRWQARRAHNARLIERAALPSLGNSQIEGDVSYRRARLTGTYDVDRQFLLLARALEGVSGHHVITPMLLDRDRAILINRGWVPQDFIAAEYPDAAPPPGEVIVEGILVPDQEDGRYGPDPPDEEPDPGVFRIDTSLLRAHFPYELATGFLQLETQEPSQPELPEPVPVPRPSDGPHLLYTIQWWLFAIAIVTISVARSSRRAKTQVR